MRRIFPLLLTGCAAASTAPPAPPSAARAPRSAPALVPLAETSTTGPKWNVEEMPGDTREISIDVKEGTWLSLDVSPDGKSIAFDLLGDLYLLPIEGGTPKKITSGAAWDIQPRFSPDGEWIAFISDRDGMDNVWLVKPDGTSPRQVTKEKENEMASPAWTPDGRFIAARKHFTSERSLGAGEVWLYHRSGGAGSMMTKRPNDQKDLGEPSFSPDGKHLYFSQDITPGAFFEYNKDPHATIYVIQRLDRASGRIEPFISAPGGSVAPTPSPDGKSIAFVRRHGLKTALFLHDIASNTDRLLYDDLDRDMQETWAVQGVYPGFDWTPDGESLVFWAKGRLHRLEVGTKKIAEIPFYIKDTRKIWQAVRFPIEADPPSFHTRLLRSVTASPDGKRVVFQALGRLWIRDLPSGAPRRLTRSKDDLFEQHPSFSRDGKLVAYTTWSDRELGTVRVVSLADGRTWPVTRAPGHFATPVFSPDGSRIVFQKLGGDVTRPRGYTRHPGLYVAPAKGGDAVLVSREGEAPSFAAENDRVYFITQEGEGEATRTLLASIELDGSDRRSHLKVALGSELVMSPDGALVAFRQNFQAFVAPFPATGSAVELGPESKSFPVVRVSFDAGTQLGFSGDGKKLHWVMGPHFYTRDLKDAFDAVEKAPAKKPDVAEKGIDLGFEVASDEPSGRIALVGARIVTMKGDQVIEDGAIVIEKSRITAVGPRASIDIPKDAQVIDVSGTTIIPGLIDVHHHGPQGSDGITPQANWALYAMLGFGVTAVHDPSHDTEAIFAASELARAGRIVAPRIYSTGTILYGARISIKASVEGLDDARHHLRRMKAAGAFTVKSYRQRRRAQRQQLLTAAREEGMMVVPEGGSIFQQNMNMIVDGHTGVEHAIPVANVYADVLQLWSQSEVGYTPTLVVAYGGIWGENYWYQESDVFAHPRLTRFAPPYVLDPRSRRRLTASEGDWGHFLTAKSASRLADAGVRVNVGAHGQREGLAVHWELRMLVQGGMTPHRALRAGTLDGARYIGLDRDLGSIEPGKLADLAVIDGDVLKDIRLAEKVRLTVLDGRVYDATTLNEVAPQKSERRSFPWE